MYRCRMMTASDADRPAGVLRITPRGLLDAAKYVRERFAALGITVPAGGRLGIAEKRVMHAMRLANAIRPDDVDNLRRLTAAHWTVYEMDVIARAGHVPFTWRHQIQTALGGAELEEDDKNTGSRNLLFEIFVAAVLSACDFVVRPREPDLQVWIATNWTSVACKRIASPRKIRRRIKEAVDQIGRCGRPGIVACNLDRVLLETAVGGLAERVSSRRQRTVPELSRSDDELWGSDLVMGRVTFGRDARWDFSEAKPTLALEMFFQVQPTSTKQDDLLVLDLLWRAWEHRALPRFVGL